jgi:hypothetical protein
LARDDLGALKTRNDKIIENYRKMGLEIVDEITRPCFLSVVGITMDSLSVFSDQVLFLHFLL